MNSLANGRIIENSNFKEIYIPPWPGDAGGAIGSAIYKFHTINGFSKKTPREKASPYLGPMYENHNVEKILLGYKEQVSFERLGDVLNRNTESGLKNHENINIPNIYGDIQIKNVD